MSHEADLLIAALNLAPHPEGGHFRETFRDGGDGDLETPPLPSLAVRPISKSSSGAFAGRTPATVHTLPLQTSPASALARARERPHSTAIYFLLKAGEVSRWHRVDAAEVWHFYRGAPLELTIGKTVQVLGPEIEQGQAPQAVVPKGIWQMARSLGDYTLVGCTVAPGFEFASFEMAPEGFEPDG